MIHLRRPETGPGGFSFFLPRQTEGKMDIETEPHVPPSGFWLIPMTQLIQDTNPSATKPQYYDLLFLRISYQNF